MKASLVFQQQVCNYTSLFNDQYELFWFVTGTPREYVKPSIEAYLPHNHYQKMAPTLYAPGQHIDVLATNNPFPVEIYDCSHVAFNYNSISDDEKITETFSGSRASDGREPFKQAKFDKLAHFSDNKSSNDSKGVPASLSYSFPPSAMWWPTHKWQAPVFKAKSMVDKWDIYRRDKELLFVRSWSQFPAYRVTIKVKATAPMPADLMADMKAELHGDKTCVKSFSLESIEWAGNISTEDAIQQIDFLIKRYLLGLMTPAPLPEMLDLSNEIQLEGAFTHLFSTYGRSAAFATKSGANYARLYNNMSSLPA